jgi:hypothetical protein
MMQIEMAAIGQHRYFVHSTPMQLNLHPTAKDYVCCQQQGS